MSYYHRKGHVSLDRQPLEVGQSTARTVMMQECRQAGTQAVQATQQRMRIIGWNPNATTVSSHRESLTRPTQFAAIARRRLKYYCQGAHAAGATPLDSQALALQCQKTDNSVFLPKTKPKPTDHRKCETVTTVNGSSFPSSAAVEGLFTCAGLIATFR